MLLQAADLRLVAVCATSAKLLALLCVLLCALRECGRRSPTAKRGLKPKVLEQLRLRMSWRIFER